ncbi:MAG: hypothetical protein ACXAEU_01525 [Candidatus Hodarchaeales archaeon]|jgi:hypothetical protein
MKVDLSKNEKTVLRNFFSMRNLSKDGCSWIEPSINELIGSLVDQLENKRGEKLTGSPDARFVSKLKSTGLDKIAKSLENLAQSMRLDYDHFDDYKQKSKKYHKKSLGILKGFNFSLNTYVYLVYTFGKDISGERGMSSFSSGAIAWYIHDASTCKNCHTGGECYEVLEQIMRERSLEVPSGTELNDLGKKAEWVLKMLNEEWDERCK